MTNKQQQIPAIRFNGFTDTWEQRKVFDMSEITFGGGTPKTGNEDYWQGNFPWIQSSDLKNDQLCNVIPTKFITDEAINKSATKAVPANSIAVVTRVGVGKLALMPYPYATSQDFLSLSNLKVDPWFGVYSLYVLIQKEINNIQGTSIKGMTKSDLLSKNIHIPFALDEQTKIGNFFKQLDDTIALHQRKLEKTKALKSAYLSELFPVEGERKPKRRFAGFIDDWKQGTVGEYGYFYYGKSAPKWSVTKDAIIPCVRYGELYTKFGAKIDKVYSYTNISKENLKFSTGNEVLVPRVGEDPLDFANCSWLSIPNVAIGEMISVYNTEENPLFISYYFNSQLRHAFAKRVEGGNVSNLYFTYLENITISIPNKEEQDTIANFLESLDSVVEHHQHKLEKLKNIKQAYLNELFV